MFEQDKLIESQYGFIFENDLNWFEENCTNYATKDINNNDNDKLHMDLYPEQIVGNPDSAKVFLLNMNPSFDPSNHQSQKVIQPAIAESINGNPDPDYPFYFLNPNYDSTDGSKWWRNGHHFKSWERKVSRSNLAKSFCAVELFPYHCKKLPSKIAKNLPSCPSTKKVVDFIKKEIVPKAQENKAVIIILRCKKLWGVNDDPNNNIFITSNRQTANFSFSMKNSFCNKICKICGF